MSGNWAAVSRISSRSVHSSCLYSFHCSTASCFQTTITAIDKVMVGMTEAEPVHRMNVWEALDRLRAVVHSMAPESLLIEPVVLKD